MYIYLVRDEKNSARKNVKHKVFVKFNILTRNVQNSVMNTWRERYNRIKDKQTYSNKIKIRTT